MTRLFAVCLLLTAATCLFACGGDDDASPAPPGPFSDNPLQDPAVRDALSDLARRGMRDAESIAEMAQHGFEVSEAQLEQFFEAYPKYIQAMRGGDPAAMARIRDIHPVVLTQIAAKFAVLHSGGAGGISVDRLPANMRMTEAERALLERNRARYEEMMRSLE